jgi:hypothetical protein
MVVAAEVEAFQIMEHLGVLEVEAKGEIRQIKLALLERTTQEAEEAEEAVELCPEVMELQAALASLLLLIQTHLQLLHLLVGV